MTPTRVKICGLTRAEDVERAVARGAHAVGFVLWSGSPRAISPEHARDIGGRVPAFVARVGVFVDATPETVARTRGEARLDAIQLHGDEEAEPFAPLAARVIKAVTLATDLDLERAEALPESVTVLVDAVAGERRGGTGQRADWARAARLAGRRPVILAGGLSPETVGAAIERVRPWAVDVSSGVERAPGVKDPDRLDAFFRAVEAADRARQS